MTLDVERATGALAELVARCAELGWEVSWMGGVGGVPALLRGRRGLRLVRHRGEPQGEPPCGAGDVHGRGVRGAGGGGVSEMVAESEQVTDPLSGEFAVTLSWRQWSMLAQGCLRAAEATRLYGKAERQAFLDLASRIDRELGRSAPWQDWLRAQGATEEQIAEEVAWWA